LPFAASRDTALAMPDQPIPANSALPHNAPLGQFPEPGEPVFHGFNRLGLWTLYMKEVRRFFKVQTQTIWAPAVTTLLYLIIFTLAMGGGGAGRTVLGVSFASFVAPGLIAMGMTNNAFANSSFGLLVGKMQGTIVDYLMPPISEAELLAALVGAAVTRAILVGLALYFVMMWWPGVDLSMHHVWAVVWFGLMGSVLFALIGVLTSLWAEKFDHNAAVTNFVITPMAMLSGTFYVITRLSPVFRSISAFNPVFYVISGFRFGFLGQSDIGATNDAVIGAALGLGALNSLLALLTYALLRSGWKLRN
jgi:ABC-2 type transport system permease protein